MKIVFDTEKNEVKVGSKTFGVDMPVEKQNCIISFFNKFVKDHTTLHDFNGYEDDSMWMSYRYCIGRHTIASHMRAGDIASHCYGRMSDEHSIFTAFDINREIERAMQFGCGPTWYFPITSLNRIYTSAVDIFCQFVEDYNIQAKDDLLKYKEVHVKLYDNEHGYTFETVTWEEYLKHQVWEIVSDYYGNKDMLEDFAWRYFVHWEEKPEEMTQTEMIEKFKKLVERRPSKEHFYLSSLDDLMVWNDLVHLFDLEHHHKSVLTNGEEVEWFWTYTHDTYEKPEDPGHYYQKEIGYKKIRVPVDAKIGSVTTWIPDEYIIKDLY